MNLFNVRQRCLRRGRRCPFVALNAVVRSTARRWFLQAAVEPRRWSLLHRGRRCVAPTVVKWAKRREVGYGPGAFQFYSQSEGCCRLVRIPLANR